MIKLIVGLGNPGTEYKNTRHNVGFDALDILHEKLLASPYKAKCKSLISESFVDGQRVLLAKPQTYMNLSGNALKEIIDWYKINLENIIVMYDDIDIPPGILKVRALGGPGTHNGLKNIVAVLNEKNFARIRIGIGQPPAYMDLADYVLGKYKNTDAAERILRSVEKASDAALCFIKSGINLTMNRFNLPSSTDEPSI